MTDTEPLDPVPPPAGVPPWVVALLRGVAEAALLAVVGVLILWLTENDAGDLAPYAPFGLLLLRQVEGFIDTKVDPTRQRVVGGAPPQ